LLSIDCEGVPGELPDGVCDADNVIPAMASAPQAAKMFLSMLLCLLCLTAFMRAGTP
jgi:hypothetical protein